MSSNTDSELYGVIARFEGEHELLDSANKAREAGYTDMDAFTPEPIHGLSEALGQPRTKLPWISFAAGATGAISGFMLQYWTAAVDYQVPIGGRPFNSWVAFIPVTFECMVLFAAFATVLSFFFVCGFPQPYHPVFGVKGFERASTDYFYLCIKAKDPKFGAESAESFMQGAGALEVHRVPM